MKLVHPLIIFKYLTLEPMMLFYYVASQTATLVGMNLLLQKACHPGSTHEPDVNLPCEDEVKAQKLITDINTWRPSLEYTIPVFFIIFVGQWSDTHGKRRKPILFIPVIGETLSVLFVTLSVYFWTWSPELTAIIESVFRGITGGRTCFSIGAATYLADISGVEERTLRLGIMTALIFIGTPIGNALGGYLRVQYGFYVVNGVCLSMTVLALLLGILLVKNTASEESNLKPWQGIFDLSKLTQSVKTVLKQRENYKRTLLILMVIISPLFGACFYGEYSVLYFFLRYKFHWGEVEYGFYSAYKLTTIVIGCVISVLVFSKYLKMSDAVIGLIATMTQIIAAVCSAFAEHEWQLYVYPLLDFMHGAVYTVSMAIVSKTVDGSELGQVNSILGVVNSLVPLIVFPTFNKFYSLTFQIMPGAFFLLSSSISLVTLILFVFVLYINIQNKNKESKAKIKTTTP